MKEIDDLEGLVHAPLEEASAGLESLIEQHKSAVERFDLLHTGRPSLRVWGGGRQSEEETTSRSEGSRSGSGKGYTGRS
jgi:hypothetical protein